MKISELPDLPILPPTAFVPVVSDGSTFKAAVAAFSSSGTSEGGDSYAVEPALKPPTLPDARNDEFTGNALDSKWLWINQATATATVSNGRLVLKRPNVGAGTNLSYIYQPVLNENWSFTTKLKMLGTLTNPTSQGIIVGSNSEKIIIFNIGFPGLQYRYEVNRLNSVTAFVSAITTRTTTAPVPFARSFEYYARIERSNNNLIFSISRDGFDFDIEVLTVTPISDFLITADRVGFDLQAINGDAGLAVRFARFNWVAGTA